MQLLKNRCGVFNVHLGCECIAACWLVGWDNSATVDLLLQVALSGLVCCWGSGGLPAQGWAPVIVE